MEKFFCILTVPITSLYIHTMHAGKQLSVCGNDTRDLLNHVGRQNVTGENMLNTFCPGRGSNQDLLRGSQTLYRVAIKAGLYCKAVQVCIIPNITTCAAS